MEPINPQITDSVTQTIMPNAKQTIMKILVLIDHYAESEDLAVPVQVQAIKDLATAVNTLSLAISQPDIGKDKIELAKLQVQAAMHDGDKTTATKPKSGS